jgi:phosphoglycolate phosphatase
MADVARDVLLFDLDGTLVDSAPTIAAALSALRAERGGKSPVAADEIRPWISLGVDRLVANVLAGLAGESGADVAAFRAKLRAMPNDRSCLYPGVEETLHALRRSGATMAVITNKPEALSRALLDEIDLGHLFAAIVGGDTTPHGKPHRAPIDHALALLDVSAERCWFIGDSEVDAAAARVFAIPFLLFAGGYGGERCRDEDVRSRFESFAALPGLLGQG